MLKRKGLLFFAFLLTLWVVSEGEAAVKDEAIRLRIQGYQIQHKGDLDKASEKYKQAIQTDPNYAAPHNDLGIVYEEKGWLDQAEKEYLETLKIDPNYVDAYSNLAILYEKSHQKEKMMDALQKRVSLGDPDDVGTQEARAKLEALGMIVEVKPPTPELPPPSKKLAPRKAPPLKKVSTPEKVKATGGLPKKAESKKEEPVVKEVVKAEPKIKKESSEREVEPVEEATLLRNEGLKRQLRGDLEGSLRFYRTAIKIYPKFATAHNDLGVVLEKKGFLDAAEGKYLKALSLDPDYDQALYNLAFLYVKMGRTKEAIGYLEKIVLRGDLEELWVKIARNQLRVLQGEEEKEKARESKEERERGEVTRGEQKAQTEAALRQKILTELQDEITQQERLALLFEQGKAAYRKGDYETAEDYFEKMLLIDPKNPLAKSYLEKTQRAIQEVRRKEQETRRRAEERKLRLALEAKRKKEVKADKRSTLETRLKRLKEEIEKRKLAREAEEKAFAEKKRIEEEQKKAEAEKKKAGQEILYEEAKKRYREGELQKSLSEFEKLLASAPDHPYAKRYVDKIREKLKEQEEQERAQREAAKQAEFKRKQEVAAHLSDGERLLKKKGFKNAVSELKAVLRLEPSHEKGGRLLKKAEEGLEKEHQKSRLAKEKKKDDLARRVEEKLRKRAQAYYEEGLRVERRGETAKAIYAFEKALFLNDDHQKARKQLTYLKEKEPAGEQKSWRIEQKTPEKPEKPEKPKEPIERSPRDSEESRLYRRAKAAYDEGNYDLSRQTLQYLLTLNPNHAFAQGDLEEVEERIRSQRHKEAVATASLKKEREKIIEPVSASEKETFSRAEHALQGAEPLKRERLQEGPVRSVTKEDEARSLMEQRALEYQQKAYELQQQNDIEGAVSYYQKAMSIRPSAGAANGLGILYERKGWFVQAEDAYKRALSLEPRYLAAHTNLALLYEGLGRSGEALRHWKVRSEMGDAGDLWTQKAHTHLNSARLER